MAPRTPHSFLLVALLLAATPVAARVPLREWLPATGSTDSLAPALRRLEARNEPGLAASAAYELGLFLQVRGEYRDAAAAFGRAAGRMQDWERAEARYRQGLAWLGAREPGKARASFEEVARSASSLRPLAQFGIAESYRIAGESVRAMDTLKRLLAGPAGEAEPAALERYAALCERAHRDAEANAARDRLQRRWPRSFEAQRLGPERGAAR